MIPVILKKRIGNRVENGHPWIFANEIAETEETVKAGDIVTVFNGEKKFLGRGFINPQSQIAIRLLTRNEKEEINEQFIRHRIAKAWAYRKKIGYTDNCRLVFGEADELPGLIIDKFGDHFVIQTLALGMDLWKLVITNSLKELFGSEKIYERNDVPVRELEGLPQQKGFLAAPFDTRIQFRENGLIFEADLENGQKTGYFLDQQDNRRAIRNIVKNAEVLGAFCYTGSFEVHAGHYGAKSVLGLDISEQAVAQARKNAELNGLENTVRFEAVNAFDVLKKWSREGKQFDVVMLDPPAFTKSRETIQKAAALRRQRAAEEPPPPRARVRTKTPKVKSPKAKSPRCQTVSSGCTTSFQPRIIASSISRTSENGRRASAMTRAWPKCVSAVNQTSLMTHGPTQRRQGRCLCRGVSGCPDHTVFSMPPST